MTVRMRARLRALLLTAILLCSGVAVATANTESGPTIAIQKFAFGPTEIVVEAGTTVTWINKDGEAHTVVSKESKFRSAALDTNDAFSFTFTTPGTYAYFCTLHPHMTGTVTVTAHP